MRLLALLFITSCATTPLHTQTGNPEVTINASRGQVNDELALWLITNGFAIESHTERLIVARRDAGAAVRFWVGPAQEVVSISLIDYGGRTRVVAALQTRFQNGLAQDMANTSKFAHGFQFQLETLKSRMEQA